APLRRAADIYSAPLFAQTNLGAGGKEVLWLAETTTADTLAVSVHRSSSGTRRSRSWLCRSRPSPSASLRELRHLANRSQAQITDWERQPKRSHVRGSTRWSASPRASAPTWDNSRVKGCEPRRAGRRETAARNRIHGRQYRRGYIPQYASRSGTSEPVSFLAMLQAVLRRAASTLLDEAAH